MKTKPLNNNVLIEVLRDDIVVARSDENESMKYGKLIEFSVSDYHMTASAGVQLSSNFINWEKTLLRSAVGKIVRWEEFAEGGQTFKEGGKTYALIPFWRLISFEEEN